MAYAPDYAEGLRKGELAPAIAKTSGAARALEELRTLAGELEALRNRADSALAPFRVEHPANPDSAIAKREESVAPYFAEVMALVTVCRMYVDQLDTCVSSVDAQGT